MTSKLVTLGNGSPLGIGEIHPAGSPTDSKLSELFAFYKRAVASRYKALGPTEITAINLPPGPMHVSPKMDGEMWFLVADEGEVVLFSHNGRAITGEVPVLKEAAALLGPRVAGRTIIAGELFAVARVGRPRVGDMGSALSGGAAAEVARIGFMAFDLVQGGDAKAPVIGSTYAEKLETLRRLFEGGKRAQVVKTEIAIGAEEVRQKYSAWVEGGKGEGVVARTEDGRIFKIKPVFTVDAAIIGFTDRSDDPERAGSLMLALMRDDGSFHHIGSCSAHGDEDFQKRLRAKLLPEVMPSKFAHANSKGAFYRLVRPEIVIEVHCTDIQTEDSNGDPVERMVLKFSGNDGWTALQPLPCVSILHPVLERIRDDKGVNATDIRFAQVSDRVAVPQMEKRAEAVALSPSTVLRREVWTKVTKGETAVRKLLLWKTNKDAAGWPGHVVAWIDYSAGRAEPLKREVRQAPDEVSAQVIADEMVTENIKKGWARV